MKNLGRILGFNFPSAVKNSRLDFIPGLDISIEVLILMEATDCPFSDSRGK